MKRIDVTPGNGQPYRICIGNKLLDRAGDLICDAVGLRRCVIIADTGVAHLYGDALETSIQAAGHQLVGKILLPSGEGAKSFAQFEQSLRQLIQIGIDRDVLILALGGGVCGDHAGFVAASAMRGLDFVQIPTTLLAQVDSSVGGKTGINIPEGKNLVGAFHHPCLVLSDLDVLESLPQREFLAGYAELVKHAFIRDSELFSWLDKHQGKIKAKDGDVLAEALARSCAIKADIVGEDALERTGARALLNLGHTFGHALEAALGYDGRLLHGEAVSIGMCMAFDLSVAIGRCSDDDAQTAIQHLIKCGMRTDCEGLPVGDAESIYQLMQTDKKRKDGKLTFVLSNSIGDAFTSQDIDQDKILSAIQGRL